jgi:hypothetical protein
MRRYRLRVTPEQKEKDLIRRRIDRANQTDEQKQKSRDFQRKYNSTPERKTRHAAQSRDHQRRIGSTPEGKAKRREQKFEYKYGITVDQAESMFLAQGSCCAICKSTEPGSKIGWHTDHCHSAGKVRGILCHSCNVGLGYFKDKISTLQAAINYLTANSTKEK